MRRGDLNDLDGLRDAAAEADGIVHLAFDHRAAFAGDFAGAAAADLTAMRALGDALAGTGKTLMGVGLLHDHDDEVLAASPRFAVARTIAGFAERGVRSLLVGIPQVVHSTASSRR